MLILALETLLKYVRCNMAYVVQFGNVEQECLCVLRQWGTMRTSSTLSTSIAILGSLVLIGLRDYWVFLLVPPLVFFFSGARCLIIIYNAARERVPGWIRKKREIAYPRYS